MSDTITNGQYLHISNTIYTIEKLKNIKIEKYDLICIDNLVCNDTIIKYINKN